ncbi:MAG: proline dehydrogenase family protein, partial [Nitrospirae bacterium]|nr:proline dehydrogenase family protein [Nitrospirota bacterium]
MKNIEDRITEIGNKLYSEAINFTPSVFDKRKWEGKVLEWAMKDEHFKTQLFRFIDVLPSLKSDYSVIRILKEYFSGDIIDLLGIFKLGAGNIPDRGLMAKAAALAIRTNIRSFARQFISGGNFEEAKEKLLTLRDAGYALSCYLLGETVVSDKEADRYIEKNLQLLDMLGAFSLLWSHNSILDEDGYGHIPKVNISVKMSSVYSQIDPVDWDGSIEDAKDGLRLILKKAITVGASFTCDMEYYYLKDLVIAVFKSLIEEDEFKDFPFAGIAIQAYLRDSADDLQSLIEWARMNKRVITVRLVKGAYWDYETVINRQIGWPVPVFLSKGETDLNFEKLSRLMLKNSEVIRPAIGTHNIRSIASAIAVSEELGLPDNSIEFQMLYGMGEPIRDALEKMGYRVRIYSPIGELLPGMAYLIRRLLENTSNESFLRMSFVEKSSVEELLRTPKPSGDGIEFCPQLQESAGFQNEPPTDFSRRENREKMKEALVVVREQFDKKYPLYINGKEILTDKEIISLNPANPGEIVGKASSAAAREIEQAISGARRAWETWKVISAGERAEYLIKVAGMMKDKRFELAALQILEVGKSWNEADSDVSEAIDYLEYYGREMKRIGSGHYGNYPGEINYYHYMPRGIGIIISPWNFPLAIPTGMVAASIVTGNCAVFKPSGLSPVTAWMLVDLFNKAGLPPGVLQYLPGPGNIVGDYLVTHADIDFITFTGSRDVGLRIV